MRPLIPLRLQKQSWLAAVILFSPCLLAIVYYFPLWRHRPIAFVTLLPGLAVALHVQRQLTRHLEGNHRPGQKDQLFSTLGAGTWITLLRAGAIVSLAGFLPLTLLPGYGLPDKMRWAPGLVYIGIALADLLDGLVARRQQRETELGKHVDITADAAGLLVASLLAVSLGRLPAIYLLVGVAYYIFILGIWLRQKRRLPLVAVTPRPYARIIAGFQMGLVGGALLPIFHPGFTCVAAFIFMIPLLVGFLWDWLVVSCRVVTDGNRQIVSERQTGALLMKCISLALRFAILGCGVFILVADGFYPAHLSWHLVVGICCLLIAGGVIARSAALVLTLLLGSNLSPVGMSMPATILFGAAATLMLSGSGALSLWAPEERLLYRRKCEQTRACRKKR